MLIVLLQVYDEQEDKERDTDFKDYEQNEAHIFPDLDCSFPAFAVRSIFSRS